MPSSPRIKKEDMLQAALELVSRDGYAALNIKAVARELGCSTATAFMAVWWNGWIGCEGSYIGLSIHCQTLRRRAETKCFYLRLFIYE